MAYKDVGDMIADYERFTERFAEIPDAFAVHPSYLIDGMTAAQFIEGYRAYRALLMSVQLDMCDKPEEWGLVRRGKSGTAKPIHFMDYPAMWLFVAFCQAGEVRGDVLYVDAACFGELRAGKAIGSHTAVPRNIDEMVAKLPEFGISATGFGQAGAFTVASDVPRLVTAAKASTLSQYCRKSLKSDYCSFNYRLYTIGADDPVPIQLTRTFLSMPETSKGIMLTLLGELAKNGWRSYRARHHSVDNGWLSFGAVELYYQSNGTFTVLIAPWTAHQHHPYLESLPDRYRTIWAATTRPCRGCRKGDCRSRFVGELFGRRGSHCCGDKPRYPLEMEDIPAIIETCRVLAGKGAGA